MPTVCFAPGCDTGYNSAKKKVTSGERKAISLFMAPKDEALFEEWRKAIPRIDRILQKNDRICEKHFAEDDIQWFFEEKMPDGALFRLTRGRPTLKKGAVPSIFPNLPAYYTKSRKKRKAPLDRSTRQHTKPIIIRNIVAVPDSDAEHSDEMEFLSSLTSIQDIAMELEAPNDSWVLCRLPNYIAWIKWTDTFVVEKKLVITQDLQIKVFLGDREATTMSVSYTGLQNAGQLLKKLDELQICLGFNRNDAGCIGYKEEGDDVPEHIIVCAPCYERNNQVTALFPKRPGANDELVKRLRENARSLTRKNHRLSLKVELLKKKLFAAEEYNRID